MHSIHFDYNSFFRDRLLIITGAARSGTTILGKTVGSMQPNWFLFEPYIMRLFGTMVGKWTPLILFEDYFLPLIQGRADNLNSSDDSYMFNYRSEFATGLSRRKDAIEFIKREKPLFIIKMPEFQPYFGTAKQIFPDVRFIHIIRSGNDVVQSAIRREWYTDDWIKTEMIELADDQNAPWYLDEESRKRWPDWNPATRAACAWRCCVEKGKFDENDRGYTINYEDFVAQPIPYIEIFKIWLGLQITDITKGHLKGMHEPRKYPSILNEIREPERARYEKLMGELGYEV